MHARTASLAVVSLLLALAAPARAEAPHTLTIATIAPEGSSWTKLLREWDRAVRRRTAGRVRLKVHTGTLMEDESDLLQLMKRGKVQGVAVTGAALGRLQPEIRVLESLLLLRSEAELDFLWQRLGDYFRRKFEDRGYALLIAADGGWVHAFSDRPLVVLEDIKRAQAWVHMDDPSARSLMAALGASAVPLGITGVLPAITTGQVTMAYGPPLSTLLLGWHRKLRYMADLRFCAMLVAVVVLKKELDAIPVEDRRALVEEAHAIEAKLGKDSRAANAAAVAQMRRAGLRVYRLPRPSVAQLERICEKVRERLAGSLYSREAFEQVKRLLAEYRSGKR